MSTVIEQSLSIQIIVVSFVAMLATVGVYGLVALIVRMDDIGLIVLMMVKLVMKIKLNFSHP